ncbi:MAG: bifunctional transcriptional activator/DNA repair enzyme AdaA [Alphaproteobacteria bacterium]
MPETLPSDDVLYAALLARDPAFDGIAYAAVKSTGVFCRLTCPARKPKREHTVFFPTIPACLEAGFRPCKRCRPLAPVTDADPIVRTLLRALEKEPGRRWREEDIAAMGFDPSTVRRAFKRHFGVTFLEMARLSRIRSGAETLSAGARVIEAQLEAGFESGSGFRTAFARILGRPPATFRGDEALKADWLETPLGPMIAIADREALYLLEFYDRKALRAELARLERETRSTIGVGHQPPVDQIQAELSAYFAGKGSEFKTALAQPGSPFLRAVWDELRKIPPGETRSYGEIAAAIGTQGAVRAVARANGLNRIAIVVPCHRVIGADGALTGYGGGLWRKRWLIAHERTFSVERKMEHTE